MSTSEPNQFRAVDLTGALTQAYAKLDPARSAALAGLLAVRTAKLRQLARLDTAPGAAPGAPLAGALAAHRAFTSALTRLTAAAHTELPAAEEGVAIVHGYVWLETDAVLRAAPDVSVTLAEASEPGLGQTIVQGATDERGYFCLRVPLAGRTEQVANGAGKTGPTRLAKLVPAAGTRAQSLAKAMTVPLEPGAVIFRELTLPPTPESSE